MKDKSQNSVLVQLLKKGDRVAFYRLFEKYSKRLYIFVLQYVKQEADAEEILQDVFVKLWETREKINEDLSFDNYLFAIAYNQTISVLRKRVTERKYLEYLQSIQNPEENFDMMETIYAKDLQEKIDTLLKDITPRQKEIFKLSRYKGLSNDDIAKKLKISVFTVKKHISNTLTFLKGHILNE